MAMRTTLMAKKKVPAEQPASEATEGKIQVSVRLTEEWLERLRNAIFWTGQGLSIQSVLEEAAVAAILQLEKDRNHGKPFAPRTQEIRPGRRST